MSQDWDAGRLDSDLEGVAFDTLAVRAGQHRTPEGEHGDPMFFTSSYVFRTAADAAARFAGKCRATFTRATPTRPCVRSKSVLLLWKVPSKPWLLPPAWPRSWRW